VRAVRELVAEGTFHESTVEQVADRAGVSRATLYQHFRSRIELIDALCETFSANPAIMEIRSVVDQPDGRSALDVTIADAHRFWSAEDAVLQPLYGLTGIDPAARELVERQRADRRGEMDRLAANLDRQGLLQDGTNRRRAVAVLLVLTSYETFRELRAEGYSDRQAVSLLQESGRTLLLRAG